MATPLIRSIVLAVVPFTVAAAQQRPSNAAPRPDCTRFIGHVSHDGVSFSVSIDATNDALTIVVPEKAGVDPAPIRVRLKMRDDTIVEGAPQRMPSVGSGGSVDWRYRLEAKRPLAIASIFSVSITIGNRAFDVYPW